MEFICMVMFTGNDVNANDLFQINVVCTEDIGFNAPSL